MQIDKEGLLPDITFKATRSGGKGGQHVNKVSTRVELFFAIADSALFSPVQKERLQLVLAGRLTATGSLRVVCDESRSQFANRDRAVEKLIGLLTAGLYEQPKRKASKIPRKVKEARLEEKRRTSLRKISRRNPEH